MMLVCDQLIALRKMLEWLSLEDGTIVGNQIQHARFEHKEPSADPRSIAGRFFLEGNDFFRCVDIQCAESARRLGGSHRSLFPVPTMVFYKVE